MITTSTERGHERSSRLRGAWLSALLVPALLGGAPRAALGQEGAAEREVEAEVLEFPEHVTPRTVEAIEKGLRWLARAQGRDGSLRESGGMGSFPVAMSSLAGMAFLGNGDTASRGRYAPVVRRIVRYLVDPRQVRSSGLITASGAGEESRSMYGHGFAVMFLAQALGEEGDPVLERRIRQVLQNGIALTSKAQSGPGGWYYTPDSQSDEGSVTVTQVQALRACQNAGLAVPYEVIRRAVGYIEASAQRDGGIAYSAQSSGSNPGITAAACAVLYNAGEYDSKVALRCLDYCRRQIRVDGLAQGFGHWFYTQLYLSQAYWQAGERDWDGYYPRVRDHLLRSQGADGSWDGDGVGKVYGTSLAITILTLPFERVPLYMR